MIFNSATKLILDEEIQAVLTYRLQRQKQKENAIEDIYDGTLYKKLLKRGGFLHNNQNITLGGNIDGVSPGRWSKNTLWPVYFNINELPPNIR